MDYQGLYQQKKVTAQYAVKVIKSGDWVDYGWCVNHPVALDQALAARKDELEDVKVRGGVTLWMPEICKGEDAGSHFTWAPWHCSGVDRKIIARGMGYFAPMRYSELPKLYREELPPVDVAMITVPPMDQFGNFSLSMSPSHLYDMLAKAKCVILEVNENLPWVNGLFQAEINIRHVDMVVEGDNPALAELMAPVATQVDRRVAELIVPHIPDGACLQLGIGGMPNSVGSLIAQSDLKDLGVHTEMYVDAFVDISMAGKITGSRKAIDPGRQVYAFAAGTKKMFEFMNRNPAVMGAPVGYTNDVRVMSQIDKLISINNAVDMDLYGQINAESAGSRQISGTGGQLDFVMGAYLSKGGKSIICMSSSMEDQKGRRQSRILPALAKNGIVTDPRSCAHYVCTEYGIVNLKGRNTWQRAELLISIAHPDFRDELVRQAGNLGIWRASHKR